MDCPLALVHMTEQKPSPGQLDAEIANKVVEIIGYKNLRLDIDGYWIADDPEDDEEIHISPTLARELLRVLRKVKAKLDRKAKGFGK